MEAPTQTDRAIDGTAGPRMFLAAFSLAAGVIHAAVVPEHLEEGWTFGLFFILAAGFQIAWAIAVLVEPSALVPAIGGLANGAMIGVWVASRTIGLPVGPHAWMPEPVEALDLTATSLELLLVIGSGAHVWRQVQRMTRDGRSRPTTRHAATWPGA